MAQPNVVREPSMDEILASIRRIIESNEPPIGAPGMLEPKFSGNAAQDDANFDDEIIIADFHAEEARRAVVEVVVEEDEPVHTVQAEVPAGQPAMSLADVAARVRAASERNGMLLRETGARSETVAEQVVPRSDSPLMTASMAPAKAAGLQVQAEWAEPARPQSVQHETVPEPTVAPQRASSTSASLSIVSPAVGAQVANSFGSLVEAVEAGPRRSFDEIAEEMLRPMLQEWLDDNLPTLVERLVREEIERVARGPRR